MHLRRCDASQLHKADKNIITERFLVEFFSDHPYSFLYVYDNSVLIAIISADDMQCAEYRYDLNKDYIFRLSDVPTVKDAYDLFLKTPDLDRAAILDDCSCDVIYEYTTDDPPPVSRNIAKNMMALRYINLLRDHILRLFRKNKWENILISGGRDVYEILRTELPELKFSRCEDLLSVRESFDLVLDFKYRKFLRWYLNLPFTLHDLSEILVGPAMSALAEHCRACGTKLLLLNMPTFESLTCLSDMELSCHEKNAVLRDVASDEEYMRLFCTSERDYRYIKRNMHTLTQLFDDGYCNIQSNVSAEDLTISDGIRATLPVMHNAEVNINLFGTCTTFGVCCTDDETIASYIQDSDICRSRHIRVINRGGMYRSHLLNTIMLALRTKIRAGDAVVILDYFSEPKDITAICGEKITDTSDWFNTEKDKNSVMFLDHPSHCNARANRIYAEHITKLLFDKKTVVSSGESIALNTKRRNYMDVNEIVFDPTNRLDITNVRVGAHLKFLSNYKTGFKKIGMMIIHAAPFTIGHEYLARTALEHEEYLYVFVLSDYYGYFTPIDRLLMAKAALARYKNICVLPSEPYFSSPQYFPEYTAAGRSRFTEESNLSSKILMMETIFTKYVCKTLNVSSRYVGEERGDPVTRQYNAVVKRMCLEYGISFYEIPRITLDGTTVSASTCRTLLKEGRTDILKRYLPPSVLEYLMLNAVCETDIPSII